MRRDRLQLARIAVVLVLCAAAALTDGTLAQTRARPRARKPERLADPPQWTPEVLDVFFADALKALGPAPARIAKNNSGRAAPTTEEASGAKQKNAWSRLIAAEVLEDEVKQLVAQTAADSASPARFKAGGSEQARVDFSELAALFAIIAQYDGDVRWKASAPGLRARFAHAGHNCKAASDAAFREAQSRAAELAELVRGASTEVDGQSGAAPDEPPIDREPLMARLELAQEKRISAWTADRRQFERNRTAIAHEAQLIAAIARLIQDPDYEFADDPNYQSYARQLERQAAALSRLASDGESTEVDRGVKAINQSCERCHADFRG